METKNKNAKANILTFVMIVVLSLFVIPSIFSLYRIIVPAQGEDFAAIIVLPLLFLIGIFLMIAIFSKKFLKKDSSENNPTNSLNFRVILNKDSAAKRFLNALKNVFLISCFFAVLAWVMDSLFPGILVDSYSDVLGINNMIFGFFLFGAIVYVFSETFIFKKKGDDKAEVKK